MKHRRETQNISKEQEMNDYADLKINRKTLKSKSYFKSKCMK